MNAKEQEQEKEVLEVLELIRPYLISDGGDVEYLGIEDGYVKIKMLGACVGCGIADVTIYQGIEQSLVEEVPGIKGVKVEEGMDL